MARKPGPKTETADPLARVTLTLDELTRRRLRVLGDGNESAGVRVAARVAYERYQRSASGAERSGDEQP
jgi:urease accessory protein UreE